jgi:nucleoside-diphosphate-sugar epimerase
MRVLITGATGFVGSHLVDLLAGPEREAGPTGVLPRILLRPTSDTRYLDGLNVQKVFGTLGDETALRSAVADVEVVIHLAALTRARNEKGFLAANEEGTRNLLDAAIDGGVTRFVYVSSLAAAGPALDGVPVEPHHEPHPLTAYGRSKLAGERACQESADEIDTIILRPPAVYGPRDRDLLTFFKLANLGFLPVPAGPVRSLQLIHVSDLAQGTLAAAMAEGVSGTYHIADPDVYPWREVLELIALSVGRRGRKIPIPQPLLRIAGVVNGTLGRVSGHPQVFDSDKVRELLAPGWLCETEAAERDLGFKAATSLEEGLRETAAWYRDQGWLR